MVYGDFEAVIGLEVHCQLSTETKIFCSCRARVAEDVNTGDLAPNSNTCPICVGHPGTLPVLNAQAVEFAIKAGLATGCRINPRNVFARKNYFYPDLPKGYQISQYDQPICSDGALEIEVEGAASRTIGIERIHLEEDAGKNVHLSGCSLVNLNRAGTPLIEIVSRPALKSAQEAGAYLRSLHAIVTSLRICDGNMQNGNFRCDANVSVMPRGSQKLGTRAEIKNVNSFRFVEKAIEYEIARQIEIVKAGGKVVQETRTYDAARNATASMRSKEEAQDYRYFPDPDLVTIRIADSTIEKLRQSMPELPARKKVRYMSELGLSAYDAGLIAYSVQLSEFFEKALQILDAAAQTLAKPIANYLGGEVNRLINEEGVDLAQSKLTPTHLAEVAKLASEQTISSGGAKAAISQAWKSGDSVSAIVDKLGLKQVSDTSALDPLIDKVIQDHPSQVAEFKSGKEKLIGFFVGQVMKQSGGKANPALLQELIKKRLLS